MREQSSLQSASVANSLPARMQSAQFVVSLFALRRNCCEMWGDHKTCLLHLMTTTDGVVAANTAAGFIICHREAMMAAGAGGRAQSLFPPLKLGKGCVKRCHAFTGIRASVDISKYQ